MDDMVNFMNALSSLVGVVILPVVILLRSNSRVGTAPSLRRPRINVESPGVAAGASIPCVVRAVRPRRRLDTGTG
jgi:hypothetical protein